MSSFLSSLLQASVTLSAAKSLVSDSFMQQSTLCYFSWSIFQDWWTQHYLESTRVKWRESNGISSARINLYDFRIFHHCEYWSYKVFADDLQWIILYSHLLYWRGKLTMLIQASMQVLATNLLNFTASCGYSGLQLRQYDFESCYCVSICWKLVIIFVLLVFECLALSVPLKKFSHAKFNANKKVIWWLLQPLFRCSSHAGIAPPPAHTWHVRSVSIDSNKQLLIRGTVGSHFFSC